MVSYVLLALAGISALLLLRAEYTGRRRQGYLFKPLATTLLLALVLSAPVPASEPYRWAIAGGLLFSLAGDVFLMLPQDRFLAGLVSFLIAHLFYVAAFHQAAGRELTAVALVPFVLYGAVLLRVLWAHLGRLRGPVLVYAAALVAMGWQAAEQHLALQTTGSLLALVGAVLFVISDSVLAYNRFVRPFESSQAVVLSTYFAAQGLIAASVLTPPT